MTQECRPRNNAIQLHQEPTKLGCDVVRGGMDSTDAGMLSVATDPWAAVVLTAVLVAAATTDLRRGRIYNWTTYPAILLGLLGHGLFGGLTGRGEHLGLVGALAGLAAGFLPALLAWLAGGLGGGDAKLLGAVGALGGWRFVLASMFYSLLVAVVLALLVLALRGRLRSTLGRVGRFIFLVFYKARPGSPATQESPRVPLGLAVAMGTAMVLFWRLIWPDSPTPMLGL